ncbi:hypothetical protein QOT17_008992 [Balamuthia mandrillaris]
MKSLTLSLAFLLLLSLLGCRPADAAGIYDELLAPSHPDAICVNKSEIDFGDSGCGEYLNYDMVYIVPGVTLPNVTGDGFEVWKEAAIGSSLPYIANSACRVTSARYLCPTYFRQCVELVSPHADPDNYTPDQVARVGHYACNFLCEEHNAPCAPTVPKEFHDEYLNCDRPNVIFFGETVHQIFPYGNVTVEAVAPNGDTWEYEYECYDGSRDVSYIVSFNCPKGMHKEGNNECAFDCPEPLLEDEEFDTITDMMSGISWIGLILMAFLVITYLVDPSRRKFPNHLSLFFFIAIMCFSFAFCLASMLPDGTKDMLCENEEEPNYFGNGACTVQGILVVYFFLAAVLWWLVICFNIFIMMIFAAKDIDWQKGSTATIMMVGYHSVAWILPLIPLIIGLAAERIGSNGSDLWCTIHSSIESNELTFIIGEGDGIETEGDTKNVWNFVLFWMPVVLCIAIGMSLITVVIIIQLKQESGLSGCWTFVKGQWRIFAFLGLYIWVCIFLFAFQLDFVNRRNDQYDAYEEHIGCLFRKSAVENYHEKIGTPVPEESRFICSISSEINYPLWVLAAFNFAGQGIFVFFIFGTSRRIYRAWWTLITTGSLLSSSSAGSADPSTERQGAGKVNRVKGKQLSGSTRDDGDEL